MGFVVLLYNIFTTNALPDLMVDRSFAPGFAHLTKMSRAHIGLDRSKSNFTRGTEFENGGSCAIPVLPTHATN